MTAVIIVTFGRVALTRRTLETLFNSGISPDKVSVTVIDNGSQPEMIELLAEFRDRIDNLVFLRVNRGKPYGWNLGASVAKERCIVGKIEEPTHYLFCDSDLDFKHGWHEKLTRAYEEHKDLLLCGLSGARWPSTKLNVKEGSTTQISVTKYPMGCCILMSAEMYRANGTFDTRRLIRTVDTSYYRNARGRGYVNASIHPDSLIEHTGRAQRSWIVNDGSPRLLP